MKSDRIKSWPKNERPRERLLANGAESLTDAELLAVILRVGQGTFQEGVAGQNATAFAKQILQEFGGLRGIDRSHIEDLAKVHGLGPAKIAQIKAAIEIGRRVRTQGAQPVAFAQADAVAAYCRPRIEGKRHESFLVLLLDGQNHLLAERLVTEGIPTQATVYVRRVMEEALRVSASAMVVVHNHPSGSPRPSAQDDTTTRDLKRAAGILGILLLDHITLGDDEFYSYSDHDRI